MAPRRRHRRSISLPELTELGPVTVHPTQNLTQLEEMVRSQVAFGGGMRGRLLPEKVEGRRVLSVMVLYTSSRTRVAVLEPSIAKPLSRKVRWQWFRGRVVTFNVEVDSEPESDGYLDVRLNSTPTDVSAQILPST
jgi:hypothetical protein